MDSKFQIHRSMNGSNTNRGELDGKVVNIELTLNSIIQGVALYFLADNTRKVLAEERWESWLYVATGLLIIFLFWSRSIIHTLTLIRWPIEFGHNFLYIACALCEVLAFTRLSEPGMWFTILALYAAVVWLLFAYDLRMIRRRDPDRAGPAARDLFALVERDQRLNIGWIMPAIFVFNLVCAFAIQTDPQLFLVKHGHVGLIAIEAIGLIVYLRAVIQAFVKLSPLIAATHAEWRDAGNGHSNME